MRKILTIQRRESRTLNLSLLGIWHTKGGDQGIGGGCVRIFVRAGREKDPGFLVPELLRETESERETKRTTWQIT